MLINHHLALSLSLARANGLLLATLASVLMVSCGGGGSSAPIDDGVPMDPPSAGNDQSPTLDNSPDVPVMPELFSMNLQIDTAGTMQVSNLRYTPSTTGAYRPTGYTTGDYVAVAYHQGDIVDAVPIRFPTEAIGTTFDENLRATQTSISEIANPIASVHINAISPIDRIDIVDADMTVHASVTELPAKVVSRRSQPLAQFPWISILEASDHEPSLAAQNISQIYDPTPGELQILTRVVDELPPRLASSIGSIAIADIGGTSGLAGGSGIFLDKSLFSRPLGMVSHIFTHEAGHTYHNVSAFAAGESGYTQWENNWPSSIVVATRQTHEEFGFTRDMMHFWWQLQASAVLSRLSRPYTEGVNYAEPHKVGFVTSYAGTLLQEDIADTVAIAAMNSTRNFSPNIGYSSRTCTYYQGLNELSEDDALAYLKIRLVQAFGLAHDDNVEWCLGNVRPTNTPGIELGDALLFDRQLNAGYTGEDRQQFNIVGQDSEGRGLAIELQTEGRPPVGVYSLDTTWWGAWDGDNTLVLASPDDFEARTGGAGQVVITYASSGDRVDGFIMQLVLLSALGPVSSFDFVPFSIPLN